MKPTKMGAWKLIILRIILSTPLIFTDNFTGDWPRQEKILLEGDIMLGALMMVHERANDPLTCGAVMPQGGVQAVEAMLYTIDWVNWHHVIPHVKLGALILDDCDKDTYGLQQAVHFIKGNIRSLEEADDFEYECYRRGSDGRLTSQKKESTKEIPISGVIAAASSVTSIQVANLLKLFRLLQVNLKIFQIIAHFSILIKTQN